MIQNTVKYFNLETTNALGYYVYRLLDPRNGETFYVGKGRGDRVFNHLNSPEDISEKAGIIRDIQNKGMEVIVIIHRHFGNNYPEKIAEQMAFEVESALIDSYAGLSNIQNGFDSGDRGCQSVNEINLKYSADEIVPQHDLIAISIPRSIEQKSLYNAVRYAWKMNANNAKDRYVLAHTKGLVRGVFEVQRWLKEGSIEFETEFKGFIKDEKTSGRFGFIGVELDKNNEVGKLYLNKRLPTEYRNNGQPIRYIDKIQSL